MINRVLRCLGPPFLELDRISHLPHPFYMVMSCSASSCLTLGDCYIALKIPPLVFYSLDLKVIVFIFDLGHVVWFGWSLLFMSFSLPFPRRIALLLELYSKFCQLCFYIITLISIYLFTTILSRRNE